MEEVYRLRRKSGGSGALGRHYVNRLVDEEGRTLFAGETPNGRFKKAVLFKDANGREAMSFGADRRMAPSAFISKDPSGDELFRIGLPFAVRLRAKAWFPLAAAKTGQEMEILPARNATDNELNRLVCFFGHEFVVRRNGETVAFSGDLSPENNPDDFARQAVTGAARKIFADLRRIPGSLRRAPPETTAGRLTLSEPDLGPAFALSLLLFRTYVFSEIVNPTETWWQGD